MTISRTSVSRCIVFVSACCVVFSISHTQLVRSHDAHTGVWTGRMSTQVVAERLVSFEGYAEIKTIELQGDMYIIKATKNGREADVRVNSMLGTITDTSKRMLFLPLAQKG